MSKICRLFIVLCTLSFNNLYLFANEGVAGHLSASSNLDDYSIHGAFDSKSDVVSAHTHNQYLQGNINILSSKAPVIVKDISNKIYNATKIQLVIYVVKETPHYQVDNMESKINEEFQNRRLYEAKVLDALKGQYAVIFLFYNDHAVTLRSNLNFLDEKAANDLLERYAYPYLPADSVGTLRYDDGVNEGVSNLYLAIANVIANHYNLELNMPKPMEQPDDVTKVVLYTMLLILIGLFILVRFGLLAWKKRG